MSLENLGEFYEFLHIVQMIFQTLGDIKYSSELARGQCFNSQLSPLDLVLYPTTKRNMIYRLTEEVTHLMTYILWSQVGGSPQVCINVLVLCKI